MTGVYVTEQQRLEVVVDGWVEQISDFSTALLFPVSCFLFPVSKQQPISFNLLRLLLPVLIVAPMMKVPEPWKGIVSLIAVFL